MDYQEIIYEKKDGVARITLNRQDKLNALTKLGIYEMTQALAEAWVDSEVGVVVLTGAGDRAFCTGADVSKRDAKGYAGTIVALPLEQIWQQATGLIRSIHKPVIARVNGYAIGGGHVLALCCDLTIASENAVFGQVGPRVGSFDPGYGTGDLIRAVGLKKAKEIWFLCRRYNAQQALEMGLANVVVPRDKLDEEVDGWCQEILTKSPTAIKLLKCAFNAELDGVVGVTNLGVAALGLYYRTEEAMEGVNAFLEKREPNFRKFVE